VTVKHSKRSTVNISVLLHWPIPPLFCCIVRSC